MAALELRSRRARLLGAALLGLASIGALGACAQTPSVGEEARAPVFEIELWPGEGRPRFQTTGRPLVLREAPDPTAAVVDSIPEPGAGEPVEFDATRYQTLEPGRIAVLSADTVRGRVLGAVASLTRDAYYADYPVETRGLAAGDTLLLLQLRAEGTCFIVLEGDVVEADLCPTYREGSFEVVAEPRTAWWVRAAPAGAEPGWILVGDAIHETERGF